MKKFYIFVISLFTINGLLAQWVPQNSGTTQLLRSVYFTDYNTGYIVGDSGTIIKTINGGNQWFPLNSGTNKELRSVNFQTPSIGYAVGKGVILKTEDAGINWINQTPTNLTESIYLNSVRIPATDTVFIAGDSTAGWSSYGLLLKTYDGGITWIMDTLIYDPVFASLKSVFFLNGKVGFACGGISAGSWTYHGIILKTTNGGLDWFSYEGGPSFYSIYFSNESCGYCVGHVNLSNISQLYKTTDAGATWESSDEFAFLYGEIFFPDMDTGFIVGVEGVYGDGSVIKSIDGGVTWSGPEIITTNELFSTFFIDGLTGYVVGHGGVIYKTTNGGTTTILELPSSNRLFELYPNPAGSELNLEFSSLPFFGHIALINIQGQTVQEHSVLSKRMQFDISSLKSGIYFVRLQNEQSIVVKKLLKN